MSLERRYNETRQLLEKYGQTHLLRFWSELEEKQRSRLLTQIDKLDWSVIPDWIENYVKGEGAIEVPTEFQPCPCFPAWPDLDQQELYEDAYELGERLIAAGKVAGFVVAGGQGTRLGFDGPKGNFPVSPIQDKTLFQIFAETLLALQEQYRAVIPWYIMTSPLNNDDTIRIFEQNAFYGLNRDDVFFFEQGTNPNFAFDGKILMANKDIVAKSPDGHGGSLKALHAGGALEDMRKRGVEQISYWQVDNPLIKIIDPLFIGLHARAGAEMSSKALRKAHPTEKVGNFCLVDGRVTVIEYSDLPEEQAHRQNPDGSLVFQLGSIAIHVISRTFVERLNQGGFGLPIHKAVKKIPHVDEHGDHVDPDKPNGVKLETFVFDALPLAENSIVLETVREEEFAPVKNASGDDSPAVTRQMMIDRAANWLEQAGVEVPRGSNGKPDAVLEIAPSFAVFPEDVREKVDQVPPIHPGQRLYLK